MAKITLTDPTGGYNSNTLVAANNALIEAAIENTLSRDGTSPNTMGANLDLNSNKIVNLTDGTALTDAVTVGQLTGTVEATLSYTASNLDAEASTANQVLLSDGAAGAAWGDVVVVAGDINAEASTDGWVLTSDGASNAAWEVLPTAAPVAGDINAEASTDGWVLTSDGAGNAAWEAQAATEVNDLSAVVTWANVPDANITESSVTQHTAAVVAAASIPASAINAEASTDGWVLTSDGASAAAWEAIPAATSTVGDLNAEASTDGQVITSDGAGNAAWEGIPTATPVVGDIDAESSIVDYLMVSDGAGNVLWQVAPTATGKTSSAKVIAHTATAHDVGFNVLPAFNFNASDTLEASHCGHLTGKTNTTAYTLTGPIDTDEDFPVGGVCQIANLGSATAYTINDTASCTMYILTDGAVTDIVGTASLAIGGWVTLYRYSTTAIYLFGQGIT